MNKERERKILEMILAEKKVTVKELAKKLYASEPSIRRDLVSLEKQNLIKRIHGGAVLEDNDSSLSKIPFAVRELESSSAKIEIARRAAELVSDGDVIFLDASSSAYNIIPYLASKSNITVITCGVKTLAKLGEYNIRAVCTGGSLLPSCYSLVGDDAYPIIEQNNANIFFFSCRGLSEDGLLTDFSTAENYIRRKMIKNSKKSYMLCASEKIGHKYFHTLCRAGDIDGIICEKKLPGALASKAAL